MSYSGCERVADLCLNLMNNASTLTEIPSSVKPASAAYVRWLSSGCALIESTLARRGYSTPVAATAQIYPFIADLEAQYGAYRAEQSRGSVRSGTGDRTRGDGFKTAFDDGIKFLMETDLTQLGVAHTSHLYAGGISVSDKAIDQGDTDVVQPRFARGVFSGTGQENNPNRNTAS